MLECARFAVFSWLLASPLAGQVWTLLPSANAPAARFDHGGAYDPVRNRLVVFGGRGFPTPTIFGDTLEFDGTNWTTRSTPVAPRARMGHGMAFDLARSRVVLFGGGDFDVTLNDTWEWDGSTWRQIPTAVAPTPRVDMAMTADLFRGGVLVHGGSRSVAALSQILGDLWRWSGSQWLL